MKKIISVALAVLMLCAVFSVGVFAASPEFKMSSASVKAGKDFEVTIKAENNPGIISAKFTLAFDGDFTLKKVEYGKDLVGMTVQPQNYSSPVILNWVSNSLKDLKGDFLYATLTFSSSKTAANGDHKIEITYDPEDVYNMQETNVNFKVKNAVVTVSGGTEKAVEAPVKNKENSASSEAGSTNPGGVVQIVSSESAKGTGSTGSESAGTKSSASADTLTTGSTGGHDDGNGNYVGEEIELEFEDADGGEAGTEVKAEEKETKPIWVFAVLAALLIVAGVVIAVIKKKTGTKGEEE